MSDSWNPDLYHRFQTDRAKPFHDLLDLVQPLGTGGTDTGGRGASATRLLDLGCGPGELTALAHRALGASETLGVDTSDAMLATAAALDVPGLHFVRGDLRELDDLPAPPRGASGGWDAIIANAALQWVPGHREVLADWRDHLRPGGQLAVQVPANPDHPSHATIAEVLAEEPFFSALDGRPPPDPLLSVQSPVQYSEMLWALGAVEQTVRLEVYGMEMSSWSDVVEWVSGTALVRVRNVLDEDLYEQFLLRYRERLGERLSHAAPYFYAFQRILVWARFA